MNTQTPNPKLLHKKFIQLGAQRHKLKNEMLALLPAIYKSRIYKRYASSIVEYAGKYGDIARSTVLKRLRLEDKLTTKPHLKAAIKEVGIHKVAMVASLATPETEEAFAEKIKNMSKPAVQTLSKELRAKKLNAEPTKCAAVPQTIKIELDEEMTFLFLKLKKEMGEGYSNKGAMKKILREAVGAKSAKKQKNEHSKPGKSVTGDTLTNEKRYIAVSKKRAADDKIQQLDNTKKEGQCSYPCCNKPAEVFHHTHRFYDNKSHDSIVPLCNDHHEFMHNNLVPNETNPQPTWELAMSTASVASASAQKADVFYEKYRQKVKE
jgi:hypothetical protein